VYRLIVVGVGGVLAGLVALQAVLAVAMLGYPGELMYGEAILYDHARRIVEGAPLYQPFGQLPLTVANYTPLYYVLAAAGQVVMPGFESGRLIALAALLAASVLVARLAMDHGHGWRTGALAALLFVAPGVPGSGSVPWTALYKEDSLALALALAALLSLTRGHAIAGGLFAAGAVLTKQTYAPMVLAAAPWLWRTDRHAWRRFVASTDPQPIVDRVCTGHLGLLVLDRPLDELDWPPSLKRALQAATRLEGLAGGRLVYAPSPSSACAGA
jgi:hypothetical protein